VETKMSATRQAQSAVPLLTVPAAIDPARVYLDFSRMKLRDLPSVDELTRDERLAGEPPALAVEAARAALARAREEIKAGHVPGDLVDRALGAPGTAPAPRAPAAHA